MLKTSSPRNQISGIMLVCGPDQASVQAQSVAGLHPLTNPMNQIRPLTSPVNCPDPVHGIMSSGFWDSSKTQQGSSSLGAAPASAMSMVAAWSTAAVVGPIFVSPHKSGSQAGALHMSRDLEERGSSIYCLGFKSLVEYRLE